MNPHSLKGTTFILISALFYASYGIWSKVMSGSFGEFNQAWTRAALLLAILVPFGLATKRFKPIAKPDWKWFFAIALAGGLNQAPYYYGFQHLPVGTATLLFYSSLTIGAFIIGRFFFGETLGWFKYLALTLAIIGMAFLYSFSLDISQWFPALCSTAAGLLGSACVVFSKKLSASYSEVQILTAIFSLMFLINGGISFQLGEQLPPITLSLPWVSQLGYTAAMLIANAAVVAGFKYLEPSLGALIGLMEIIFAAIFGIVFFQEVVTMSMFLGGGLILIAIALPDLWSVFKARLQN